MVHVAFLSSYGPISPINTVLGVLNEHSGGIDISDTTSAHQSFKHCIVAVILKGTAGTLLG
jgi:hypothetical protein